MSATVPDPDSEVPKEVRDEFFRVMKSKQSERVRSHGYAMCCFCASLVALCARPLWRGHA